MLTENDTLADRVGVMTRERGDDELSNGERDFNGVFQAERGCLGLANAPRLELDVED